MKLKRFLAGLLVCSLLSPAEAVRHINPTAYPNAKRDMIHRPEASQMKKFGSMRAAIIGTSSGAKKVAVLIVQFQPSACGGCTSGNHLIQSLANIDTYMARMQTYFNEVSYGKLTLNVRFFGAGTPGGTPQGSDTAVLANAFTLNQPMEYYGCGDEGEG